MSINTWTTPIPTYVKLTLVLKNILFQTYFQNYLGVFSVISVNNLYTQIDLPNSVHAYQTAEKIREQHPSPADEWLVFVGFVHDLGKIMGVWGEPQVRQIIYSID